MLIQYIDSKNTMAAKTANTDNNNTSKLSKKVVEVKSFYNRHFPTDRKTYNWRLPFVGLVLSVLSVHYVTTNFSVKYYFRGGENNVLIYSYIFVATALGYELHYGLKIGDRKQYTPWILFKVAELCLIFATIIYIFAQEGRRVQYHVGLYCGIIVLALNCWVTYIVISTSVKQNRGKPPPNDVDDNIYDNYDDV